MKAILTILILAYSQMAVAKEKSLKFSDFHLLLETLSFGYKVNREFEEGSGKLMIQFNAYQMNKRMKLSAKKAKIDDLVLINLRTKEVREVNYQHEKPLLLDLPTGRYCLGAVKLLSGRVIPYCKHKFFDVLKNHIELGGVITLGVYETRSGKKDLVNVIKVDRSLRFIDNYVAVNGVNELETYQRQVKNKYPISFYFYRPFGFYKVVRFLDEDRAELQEFAQNQNTYYPSLSDHTKVTGQTVYKSIKEGDLYKSIDQWSGLVVEPFESKFPWIETTESWYAKATRNIQDVSMDFDLFNQNFILVNPGLSYAKEDFLAGRTGILDVSFKMLEHIPKYGLKVQGAHKAVDVKIEEDKVSDKMVEGLVKEISAIRFYLTENEKSNQVFKSQISYKIIGEKGIVELIWGDK